MDIEENITNNILFCPQEIDYFQKMIFESLQFYSNYGQLIRNIQIKKIYGNHINMKESLKEGHIPGMAALHVLLTTNSMAIS